MPWAPWLLPSLAAVSVMIVMSIILTLVTIKTVVWLEVSESAKRAEVRLARLPSGRVAPRRCAGIPALRFRLT